MIRKGAIVVALVWTLAVTCLRAVRLPNAFATEHWFIDYRFGFVKRGLVGSVVWLATRLAHTHPTERLVDILAVAWFLLFCAGIVWLAVRVLRLSGWSNHAVLALLAFLSSPFVVMSGHLVGYFDNIIILMTILSLTMLLRSRIWAAAVVQAAAVLVHENALLIGLPVFCWTLWQLDQRRAPWAPLLPFATFVLLAISQSEAPRSLESALTSYLSSYPFIAGSISDVRVPHWITITFHESYLLHRGHFLERMLSQSMIALVLPTLLALLGVLIDRQQIAPASAESLIVLGICLVPESMHAVAWDTARIWTYTVIEAFFLVWVYAELWPSRRSSSPFVGLVCLIALLVNAISATPLMDGLRDRLDVVTRLLLYAPAIGIALMLARTNSGTGTPPLLEAQLPGSRIVR